MFTSFDTAVVITTLIFATMGLFKGAVRSILGLVKYYGAGVVTMMFYPQAKAYIGSLISVSLIANGTAIFLTYVAALIIFSIFIGVLCAAMGNTVGGPADKLLGAMVGITIGVIIGSTANLMIRSTSGGTDPEWLQNGKTYKITSQGADILSKYFENVMQKMGSDFGLSKDMDPSEMAKSLLQSSNLSTSDIDTDKLKEAIRMLKDQGTPPADIKDMINVEDYKKVIDDNTGNNLPKE